MWIGGWSHGKKERWLSVQLLPCPKTGTTMEGVGGPGQKALARAQKGQQFQAWEATSTSMSREGSVMTWWALPYGSPMFPAQPSSSSSLIAA